MIYSYHQYKGGIMKVAQVAQGSTYENKDGSEVRKVKVCSSSIIYFETILPRCKPLEIRRDRRTTLREFAEWAARPAGKKEDFGSRAVRLAKAQIR